MKKYLFVPGGLMIIAGVVWAAFAVRWTTGSVVLATGGALALVVAIAANWRDVRDWFRDPRGVFVINSILTTLLLVAVLGLVNAIASLHATRVDLTAAGRNTLTRETRAGLARLAKDVDLRQFGRTRDSAVDELLSAFAAASRHVRSGYADPERTPQAARTYGVLRDGTVVVTAGTKWRKVERPTEPALFEAITQVVTEREPVICVATGEGEHGMDDQGGSGLSQLAATLQAAGYQAPRASLVAGDVPQACEVFLIAGPSAGLSDGALQRVDGFLGRGGRVALLIDPPVEPRLRAWLVRHGVPAGDGVIIETNPAGRPVGAGPDTPLALKYFPHAITSGFELATIYGRAVPLGLIRQPEVGLPEPLAATGDRAFERLDLASDSPEFQQGRDRRGPFLLAAASRIPRGVREDQRVQEGRFVVFGDSDFVTNALLAQQGNRDLFLRTVAWLTGEREARVVSLSDRQNRRTSMTERTKTVMYAVNLGLLPLLPLLAGLVQLLRSRR